MSKMLRVLTCVLLVACAAAYPAMSGDGEDCGSAADAPCPFLRKNAQGKAAAAHANKHRKLSVDEAALLEEELEGVTISFDGDKTPTGVMAWIKKTILSPIGKKLTSGPILNFLIDMLQLKTGGYAKTLG